MRERSKYTIMMAVLLTGTAIIASCKRGDNTEIELPVKDLPSLSSADYSTVYTDSGKVTLIMHAPVVNQFDDADEPYTEFPEGILVLMYNKKNYPEATIASRFARYTKKNELWELRDSVVIVNDDGDTLKTELLFWEEKKEKLYTDRLVQITGNDGNIRGTGFESDLRLGTRKFKKGVTGDFYIKDEQKGTTGN